MLILFFTGIFLVTVYHYGRTSPFDPRHTLFSLLTLEGGSLADYERVLNTPGFYAAGAIVLGVSGISEFGFVFYPVLLLHIVVLLYAVVRRFSIGPVLAMVAAFIYILSGPDLRGAHLRLHSMGTMLLLTALLLVGIEIRNTPRNRDLSTFLPLAAVGVAILFISYNATAQLLLTLLWTFGALFFLRHAAPSGARSTLNRRSSLGLVAVAVVMLVTLVWLHYFFNYIVEYSVAMVSRPGISWVETFLSRYGSQGIDFPLSAYAWSAPVTLTYASLARYGVILASLVGFLYVLVRRAWNATPIPARYVVLFGFTGAMASFALMRMVITNNIPIGYSFLPGLFATALLFSLRGRTLSIPGSSFRMYAILGAAVLLVTALLYVPVAGPTGRLPDHDENFERTEFAATWHADHADSPVYSDVYTSDSMRLHTRDGVTPEWIGLDEAAVIAGEQLAPGHSLFVLNYGMSTLDFNSWVKLRSWALVDDEINRETALNRIYDDGTVRTHSTRITKSAG